VTLLLQCGWRQVLDKCYEVRRKRGCRGVVCAVGMGACTRAVV
jgi:hypothetical protein